MPGFCCAPSSASGSAGTKPEQGATAPGNRSILVGLTMQPMRSFLAWSSALPPAALSAALPRRLQTHPRCAATRYMAGCLDFDAQRPASAVRHMMIAQHAEPQLKSAALLVFAGMNWIGRREVRFLAVLLDTWEEFRRPEFDVHPREQSLLDRFDERPGLPADAPRLARKLWRLPIQGLREQLRLAVATRDVQLCSILAASA